MGERIKSESRELLAWIGIMLSPWAKTVVSVSDYSIEKYLIMRVRYFYSETDTFSEDNFKMSVCKAC